jgi:hypothetical protein
MSLYFVQKFNLLISSVSYFCKFSVSALLSVTIYHNLYVVKCWLFYPTDLIEPNRYTGFT